MEVARMRETFTHVVSDKQRYQRRAYKAEQQLKEVHPEAVRHENERLKQLLQVNGITYDRVVPSPNGLPTPTRSESRPFLDGRQTPLSSRQAHFTNQHSSSAGHLPSFSNQQSSFSSAQSDAQPALRQQYGLGPTLPAPGIHRALSNESATTSSNSLTPTHISNTPTFNDFTAPASVNGSAYLSGLTSPLTGVNQTPHSHETSSNCQGHSYHPQHTIDTVISHTPSFRPPVGQGFVDGRVVRNNSDERIQQRDMNHDQLGVEFVLA